ncbi:MAG: hypothetical protein ACLTWO_05850 [Blautia massiliensis (ex Durand et al. 2017)]
MVHSLLTAALILCGTGIACNVIPVLLIHFFIEDPLVARRVMVVSKLGRLLLVLGILSAIAAGIVFLVA